MTELSCDNVHFSYKNGEAVLRGCSVSFSNGAPNYLVGPSGCGKSTLALIFADVLTPHTGKLFDTQDSAIAYVLQFPELMFLADSVEAEIDTLPTDEARERAKETLRELGLVFADIAAQSPLRLSFGQRRLLALSLQSALSSSALILDEPTLGLDATHLQRIIRWATVRIADDQLVVIITHDLELISLLPGRVTIMSAGSAVWAGESEYFFRDESLLRLAASI